MAYSQPICDASISPRPAIESLNIKVTGNNNELIFKVKRTTQPKKLMNAFCERQGKAWDVVRFLSTGTRVNDIDTPEAVSFFLRSHVKYDAVGTAVDWSRPTIVIIPFAIYWGTFSLVLLAMLISWRVALYRKLKDGVKKCLSQLCSSAQKKKRTREVLRYKGHGQHRMIENGAWGMR